jgi:hypothetical protein
MALIMARKWLARVQGYCIDLMIGKLAHQGGERPGENEDVTGETVNQR